MKHRLLSRQLAKLTADGTSASATGEVSDNTAGGWVLGVGALVSMWGLVGAVGVHWFRNAKHASKSPGNSQSQSDMGRRTVGAATVTSAQKGDLRAKMARATKS